MAAIAASEAHEAAEQRQEEEAMLEAVKASHEALKQDQERLRIQ